MLAVLAARLGAGRAALAEIHGVLRWADQRFDAARMQLNTSAEQAGAAPIVAAKSARDRASAHLAAAQILLAAAEEQISAYMGVIAPGLVSEPHPAEPPVTPEAPARVDAPATYRAGFIESLPARLRPDAPTEGILSTPGGVRIEDVQSGRTGPGTGGPRLHGRMRFEAAAVDHAEGHAAAIMRTRGIREAVLYLNNVPCDYPRGCDRLLPDMLPAGAKLTVYAPGFVKVYTGTGQGVAR